MAVSFTEQDGVAVLTLDRPESLNALDLAGLRELGDLLETCAGERAVLLTGQGKAFSAGADVAEMSEAIAGDRPAELLADLVAAAHRVIRLVRSGPPSVAAINGVAAGAALGVACAADVRVASTGASFVAGFSGIGASPDSGMTWLLPRLVGAGRAAEILLRNQRISAEVAHSWGLVSQVVPGDELGSRALEVAAGLAAGPREALRRTRSLLDLGWTQSLDRHLDAEGATMVESARGPEFAEGVQAFVARRRADFGSLGGR